MQCWEACCDDNGILLLLAGGCCDKITLLAAVQDSDGRPALRTPSLLVYAWGHSEPTIDQQSGTFETTLYPTVTGTFETTLYPTVTGPGMFETTLCPTVTGMFETTLCPTDVRDHFVHTIVSGPNTSSTNYATACIQTPYD